MKKGWIILLAVLLVLALVIGINHNLAYTLWKNWFPLRLQLDESAEWAGGTSYERTPYGESPAQYLDLYIPDGVENPPLFVMIHGGGFIANDSQSRQAQLFYRYFRDHGFACASVNYRLAAEAPWPAAIEDVHDAIAFLAEHGEEYGYDASRCAVWGESAGGYLACITAVTEQAIPVKALVDYYGIVDFATTDRQFAEQGIPGWVRKIANGWASPDLLGGFNSCEEFWVRKAYADWTEEDLKNFSVPYQASLGRNPELRSMLLHGDADITVPNAQSAEMLDALIPVCGAANVELYTLHGLMHAADAFYTDTQLAKVESFVRGALGLA